MKCKEPTWPEAFIIFSQLYISKVSQPEVQTQHQHWHMASASGKNWTAAARQAQSRANCPCCEITLDARPVHSVLLPLSYRYQQLLHLQTLLKIIRESIMCKKHHLTDNIHTLKAESVNLSKSFI